MWRPGTAAFGLVCALLLAGCRPAPEISRGVELIMNAAEPNPAMTFELRFEESMVKAGQIGTATTHSPLLITPTVAGRFTWLSPRSGVFTPSGPLAMETRYELRLRPGLKRADGQSAQVSLHRSLVTPAFDLLGSYPRQASANASSEPELQLLFNADVRAAGVAGFLEFVSAEGRHIAADARHGTLEERPSGYVLGASSLRTWQQTYADRVAKQTPGAA